MTPERAWAGLCQAMSHCQGTTDPELLVRDIKAKRLFVRETEKSIAVFEPVIYPTGPRLSIYLAAGDLKDMVSKLPEIKAEAKAAGFTALLMHVRPTRRRDGWWRYLDKLGFTRGWQIYTMELA